MSETVGPAPQSAEQTQTPKAAEGQGLDATKSPGNPEAPVTNSDIEKVLNDVEEKTGAKTILTLEEERAWREQAAKLIKNGAKETKKPKEQLFVDEIGFGDYLKTFGEVSKRYGLGITNPKVAAIEAGFIVKGIVDGFNPVRITNWMWRAIDKREETRWNTSESSPVGGWMVTHVDGVLQSHRMRPDQSAAMKLGMHNNDGKPLFPFSKLNPHEQRSAAIARLKQWGPFLTGLATLPLSIVTNRAQEELAKELLRVKQNVNTRVANSLLMAEFDTNEKRNPAAIIGAVERGKGAIATLVFHTYRSFIPGMAALGAATVPLAFENPPSALLAGARGLMLLMTGKSRLTEALVENQVEAKRRGAMESRIMAIMNGMELVKTDDTEEAARELARQLTDRDRLLSGVERSQSEAEKTRERIGKAFTFGTPIVSVGWKALMDRKRGAQPEKKEIHLKDFFSRQKWTDNWSGLVNQGLEYAVPFWNAYASQEITDRTVNSLVGLYHGTLKAAVRDIKKMEEYLGDYDALDLPDGPKERARKPVGTITDWNIHIDNLDYKNILRGVKLEIPQGSFIAIRGVSGEGKSTLLRQMVGLYQPDNGSVTIGGVPVGEIKKYGEESLNSRIAYAPQRPAYFPQMTIRENIKLWSRREISDEHIKETLAKLGMEKFVDKLDDLNVYFSGGELQRLGLARAMVKKPQILYIDEPTNNLDPGSIEKVMDVVVALRRDNPGMTVVAITHDARFGEIADRVVDMGELNQAPKLAENQVLVGEADATK
ncbi:MAG: ATP-binding cassette domain-containing protein [Patescibacteria group bacterium]